MGVGLMLDGDCYADRDAKSQKGLGLLDRTCYGLLPERTHVSQLIKASSWLRSTLTHRCRGAIALIQHDIS